MSRYFQSRVFLILFGSVVAGFALVVAIWWSPPSGEPKSYIPGTPSKTRGTNLPSATGPTTIWQPKSSKIFGISDPDLIHETAGVQVSQLAAMKSIGISSVRIEASWSLVQPTGPGTFDWAQMTQTGLSIRSVMTSNGDASKPIWITEFGAPSSGPSGIGTAAQSTTLYQAINYAKKIDWVGALYIYTWQDTVTGPSIDNGFGLLTSNGSPKPAYSTVGSLIG